MFKNILVATDGSEYSQSAVRYAIKLAKECNAKLTAIYVINVRGEFGLFRALFKNADKVLENEAKKILFQVKDLGEKHGVKVDVVFRKGIPSNEILKLAEEIKADLIVMGSRGLSGIERVLVGSVTEKVIANAKCPVLVVNRYV